MTEPHMGHDLFFVLGQRSELIGREQELASLDQALDRAIATKTPQLVTILGNQGTGKSRVFAEWLQRVQGRDRLVRIYRGRAVAGGAPYTPFSRFLRERLAVPEGEDDAVQL